MKSHNITQIKAQYLQKEALSLLPRDKQNPNTGKKILKIEQWMLGDTEINLLETDSVSSSMLLAQKWPFQLLNRQKRIVYAFMAGNDTQIKGKIPKQSKSKKSLLNLSLLFRIQQKQQPYISMLAANAFLQSIKMELEKGGCDLPLHIRWKHDILVNNLKVGQISLNQAAVQSHLYTQLNVQVNVKSIPRNFGAYDFQPTYLEKHVKQQIDLMQLANSIISAVVKQLNRDQSLDQRKTEIKEMYEKQLIYLGEKVTIYDRRFEHIHHTGKFLGVTEQGSVRLQGFEEPFKDGTMKFNCEARDYLNLYKGDY